MITETLQQVLHTYRHRQKPIERCFIGYSGGRDSHVLLDALYCLRERGVLDLSHLSLFAIHVNHNLQASSADWVRHCQAVCKAYDIPLITETVTDKPQAGDSLEAFARTARYRLIAKHLNAGDIFLSAHHQRDQAETFLLQLMRGAGLDGLRAMPFERDLGAGRYVRPLLDVEYDDIIAYATARQLHFINDNSNDDTRFDRNYLRHEVLPVLEKRFAHVVGNIAQSAKWLSEVPDVIAPERLRIDTLSAQSETEQKACLRAFVKRKTGLSLSQTQTQYILAHHLSAQADKHPTLAIGNEGNYVVRRHNGEICVTAVLPDNIDLSKLETVIQWGQSRVVLNIAELHWQAGQGLSAEFADMPLILKPLRGSMRFHPHTRNRATTVKKCLHEARIPVWLRPWYLGLYVQNELLAIPGVGVARAYFDKSANARLPLWIIADKFVGL